jgi:hypothetical protein
MMKNAKQQYDVKVTFLWPRAVLGTSDAKLHSAAKSLDPPADVYLADVDAEIFRARQIFEYLPCPTAYI